MKINDLTVFIITTGKNINYPDCIKALQKQSFSFKVDIIREYSPLSVAFQEMLNRCTTKYFIQVDEDMVLQPNAIETLYNSIKNQSQYSMICYSLNDVHYGIDILGIKIYDHDIFKQFPYNTTHPSCEVEQLERVTNAGYKWLSYSNVVGQHSPKWTSEEIFNRYNVLVKKQKLLAGTCGFGNIQQTLVNRLKNKFSSLDFFALLGANSALTSPAFNSEKNYKKTNPDYLHYEQSYSDLLIEYKPLNILFLYDDDGWVFDFETRAYKQFSSHNIIRKKFNTITKNDLKDIDILLIPGSCHYKHLNDLGIIKFAKQQNIKIVVQYNSEIELDLPNYITNCDLAVASSPDIYARLNGDQKNLQFIPHFIDTHYWEDTSDTNTFKIGWVGNPECKVKNFDLLKELNFPVQIQSNYGKKFFKVNRTLQEMKDFYKEIGILLILSESEGTPMPLLESAASGKVVISTNTGLATELLSPEFIIDKQKNIVEQVNSILEDLKNNPEKIITIGKENRKKVVQKNDWFTNVLWLDNVYTQLFNKSTKKIKVVQLARVPCANSGYYLSQLLNEYSTEFESRYILGSDYSGKRPDIVPFRKFPTDLSWQTQKEECIKVIQEADIVHIHHGFWGDTKEIQDLLKDKKVITTIYDLSLENNTGYYNRKNQISTLLTVADQPAQKRVFSKWSTTYVPLVNCLFNETIIKNNPEPVIVYAPTNRYPITNSSSKGYNEVLKIINNLKKQGLKFTFDLIEGVPHEEDLNRKRKADIIIDDVINNTFHNTSIYGACFGAIAITGHSSKEYPFIYANLNTLEETLKYYITNPEILKKEQEKLTQWRTTIYTPQNLLASYENLYHNTLTLTKKTEIVQPLMNAQEVLLDLIKICQKNNCPICLLQKTCYEIVNCQKIITNKLWIGINLTDKIKQVLLNNKYQCLNDLWIKDKISIHFLPYPNKTKKWPIRGLVTNVPYPVVGYLKQRWH